jgi:hypothetical protein
MPAAASVSAATRPSSHMLAGARTKERRSTIAIVA